MFGLWCRPTWSHSVALRRPSWPGGGKTVAITTRRAISSVRSRCCWAGTLTFPLPTTHPPLSRTNKDSRTSLPVGPETKLGTVPSEGLEILRFECWKQRCNGYHWIVKNNFEPMLKRGCDICSWIGLLRRSSEFFSNCKLVEISSHVKNLGNIFVDQT